MKWCWSIFQSAGSMPSSHWTLLAPCSSPTWAQVELICPFRVSSIKQGLAGLVFLSPDFDLQYFFSSPRKFFGSSHSLTYRISSHVCGNIFGLLLSILCYHEISCNRSPPSEPEPSEPVVMSLESLSSATCKKRASKVGHSVCSTPDQC